MNPRSKTTPTFSDLGFESRGNALLELAMVLPGILLIIFAGLEIAGTISAVQVANYLSREVATVAFRECALDQSSKTAQSGSYMRADDCVDGVINRFRAETQNILPGANFVVGVYNVGFAPGAPSVRVVNDTSVRGSSGFGSKYSKSDFNASGNTTQQALSETLDAHKTVVISEVYVPLTSVKGSLARFWSYSFFSSDLIGFTNQGNLHAATVL